MAGKRKTVAVPVARGRWIEIKDGWGDCCYRCSECGEEWVLDAGTPAENNMNYCPVCGAEMRAEQEGDMSKELLVDVDVRLVDADALKQSVRKKFKALSDRYEINELVNAAPTIEAIPVEWLEGLMLSTEDDVDKVEFAWIMREWKSERKEQGAK